MIYIAVCLPFKEEDPLAKVGNSSSNALAKCEKTHYKSANFRTTPCVITTKQASNIESLMCGRWKCSDGFYR